MDIAGDDAVDQPRGVPAGDAVFEERGNIDQSRGVADGVVLVLVVRLIDAHRVIARPFAVVQAFAQCQRAFVKWRAHRQGFLRCNEMLSADYTLSSLSALRLPCRERARA